MIDNVGFGSHTLAPFSSLSEAVEPIFLALIVSSTYETETCLITSKKFIYFKSHLWALCIETQHYVPVLHLSAPTA